MLYQARGIRDSSRTNFVCRGSDGAMGLSCVVVDGRRTTPARGREPSARDDPRATGDASCSRAALPRWPAGDRPARRGRRCRGRRDVGRCRGGPSSACAPSSWHASAVRRCRGRARTAMAAGRAGAPLGALARPASAPCGGVGGGVAWAASASAAAAWPRGSAAAWPAATARRRPDVADDRDRGLGRRGRRSASRPASARPGDRLCRGGGRWRDGWSRRRPVAGVVGRRGPGRASGSRRGRSPTGVGLAAPGAVGVGVANAVPGVGTGRRSSASESDSRRARTRARRSRGRG